MNPGQKMFHDFFMKMVQDGKEDEAEKLLAECFEKQDNGTFDAAFLMSASPKMYGMIRTECTEQLKGAMAHFASQLKK